MAIICDGSCIIFNEETKISTGKQQNKDGRVLKTQHWRGNTFSLRAILLPWRGSVSAGSLLGVGGCMIATIATIAVIAVIAMAL